MAKAQTRSIGLVVSLKGDTREYEFSQDSVILGSGPTANVRLEGADVSTIHAIIKLTVESATLIDLGSESGTFLNGREIREQVLRDGDTLTIGGVSVKVELPQIAEAHTTPVTVQTPPPVMDGEPTMNAGRPGANPTIALGEDEVKTVAVSAGSSREFATPMPTPIAEIVEPGTQPQTPKAKRNAKKPAAEKPVAKKKLAADSSIAEKTTAERTNAERAANERAALEKAAKDRAAAESAAASKAVADRAAKAAAEKEAGERAAKAAADKDARDRAAKAAEDKASVERVTNERAAKAAAAEQAANERVATDKAAKMAAERSVSKTTQSPPPAVASDAGSRRAPAAKNAPAEAKRITVLPNGTFSDAETNEVILPAKPVAKAAANIAAAKAKSTAPKNDRATDPLAATKAPPARKMPPSFSPVGDDDEAQGGVDAEPSLPELDGALAGVSLDSAGIPKRVIDQELPKAERAHAGSEQLLQLALYWGEELVQVRHFERYDTISLGEFEGNDIVVAAEGVPNTMVFARKNGEAAQLYIPSDFPLEAKIGNQLHKRETLRQSGRLQPTDAAAPVHTIDLVPGERVAVRFGALTLVAQHVVPSEKFRSSFADRLDQAFVGTLVFVALFALFTFFMVLVSPRGDDTAAEDLFKAQQRFAKLLLKEEQKQPQKKFELSGKQGGKHKDEEGKMGRRDVKPRDASASKAGAPKVDPNKKEKDRKIAMSSGILGALSGGKSTAVSNVFGPGGLGTGINSALGGLKGTNVGDAGGSGGALGARGTGPGGGGKSLGIGGVGKSGERGTGGLGDVDLGGRGRAERSVEHGKTTVVGGLSMEAIKRVLDRAQSQLRFCYEKELQRVPDLYGKITVKFTIAGTGSVADASTGMTTMNNNNVEDCLLRVFKRLKFPEPQGGGVVDVSYPMIYKPQGD